MNCIVKRRLFRI